jgi:hypothetical protein
VNHLPDDFSWHISQLPVLVQRIRGCEGCAPTCPAVALAEADLSTIALAKAEVIVPSLDDWEKEWGEGNSQYRVQPKLLPVDFRSLLATVAQSN